MATNTPSKRKADVVADSVTASGTVTASGGNSGNWNTAYGWGDHSTEGYLTSAGMEEVFSSSWSSTPSNVHIKIDFDFISGSGASRFKVYDVVGNSFFGDTPSQRHYRIYVHQRSNGSTTNTFNVQVLNIQENEQYKTWDVYTKTVASGIHSVFININATYTGIKIYRTPVNNEKNESEITIARVDSTLTGATLVQAKDLGGALYYAGLGGNKIAYVDGNNLIISSNKGLKMGSSQVIDSARNISNVGTISASGRLTITDDTAGDGSWQGGILVKNTNSTAGEPAIAFQNTSMGSNYWIVGSNQDNELHFSYGTGFTDANTKMILKSDGKLGVSAGAGTLTEKLTVYGAITSTYQASNFSAGPYRASMDIVDSSKIVRIGSIKGTNTPSGDQGEVQLLVNGSVKAKFKTNSDLNLVSGGYQINGTTVIDSNSNFVGTGADNTMFSDAATARLRVGRSSNENLDFYVDDHYCKITADQDSDSNGYHAFILNRTFGGTGGSDFVVQNQGTVQFKVDKNGSATLIGPSVGTSSGDVSTHLELIGSRHDIIFKQIRTAAGSDWNNTTFRIQARVDSTNHQAIDFATDGSYNEHIDFYTGNLIKHSRFDANGNIFLRSGNNVRPEIYRVGGIFFTWDSDSYGTNEHHSIRSTNGGTWGDDITINSYHNVRVNIDTNNNNSDGTFSIGANTTGTNNTVFSITEAGDATINGNVTISGNGEELNFTGGNNRIKFSGYRALEGATDGTNLTIGESYSTVNSYADFNMASSYSIKSNGTTVIDSNGSIGVKNSSNSTGRGLSLYGGASSGAPTYGMMFAGTATFGTHGGVTGTWATYLTMSNTTNRGWIFKRGSTNVASVDGDGDARFASVGVTNIVTNKLVKFNGTVLDDSVFSDDGSNGTCGGSFTATGNLSASNGYVKSNTGYQVGVNTVIDSARYATFAGMRCDGIGRFISTNDAQLEVNGNNTSWAGIKFVDSGGSDYLWYYGATDTWAFGGGGATGVANKRIHCDGGMTIGSTYDTTDPGANSLKVQSNISAGNNITADGTITSGTNGHISTGTGGNISAYGNVKATYGSFQVGTSSTTVIDNSRNLTVKTSRIEGGVRVNYASSAWWTASSGSQTGEYGGSFSQNGGTSENSCGYDLTPFGGRGLVWKAHNNDTSSNADGGWNKDISGLSSSKGYLSVIYVRRTGSNTSGSFYHGCHGSSTLNLSGSANTNPYFKSTGISNLPQDVWCVSIGFINANGDSSTSNYGGLYRLDTGQKILTNTTFKMKSGSTTQRHRVYLYYSTSSSAKLEFYAPGFYEINGSEPGLSELLGSGGGLTTINGIGEKTVAGGVGSYVMAMEMGSNRTARNIGDTLAGSNLRPASIAFNNSSSGGDPNTGTANIDGNYVSGPGTDDNSTLSGTWRLMGAYADGYTYNDYPVALWLRIS